MKICPKCQLEYDDEFAYCAKCGVSLEIKPQEYFCPTCGKLLGKKYDSFCPYCGQSFEDNSHNNSTSIVSSTGTTTITNYNLDVARKMLQNQEKQEINKQLPKYNGKWIGFKGRIIRKDYVPKVLVLSFFSLIIMLIIPYLIEKTNLIYNLRYFTSFFDSSYLKSSIYDFVLLGVAQIIVSIFLLGLTIRRFRDMGKSICIVIGAYVLAMVTGYFFPKTPYVGNIIVFLSILYGCFGKSVFEDELLLFNNKFEASNLQYACYGVVIVIAVSIYSLISTHSKYTIPIQQALSTNGYWVYIEDTCFIRIPVLDKDARGIPVYQKPGIKKILLKEFDKIGDNELLTIASGNTNTEVSFGKDVLNNDRYTGWTFCSSDVLKNFKEEDKDNYKRRIAGIVKSSVDDVIVRKANKPEELNTSNALVQDFSVKDDGVMIYDFFNKKIHYRISIDFKINPNNEFQELEKQSFENMAKNVIWKF